VTDTISGQHPYAARGTTVDQQHADASAQFDTSRPHPARMYDWFLCGKDNYPVDEELGRQLVSFAQSSPSWPG
jgi:hypothetical protein